MTAQAVETVVAQLADAGLKLALAPAGGLACELACVLQHISVPQLVRWRGSNPRPMASEVRTVQRVSESVSLDLQCFGG